MPPALLLFPSGGFIPFLPVCFTHQNARPLPPPSSGLGQWALSLSLSLSLTHTHTGKGRDGQSRSPKRVFILPPPSSSSSFAFGVCRSQSSYVQLQSMFLFLSPPSSLRLQRLESLLQRSSHALFLCSCDMKRGRERRRHKKGRRRQEKGLRKNTTQVYLVVYRLILYTYV